MNPDERHLYKVIFLCKEALMEILEEAESDDRDWDTVIAAAQHALEEFEDE